MIGLDADELRVLLAEVAGALEAILDDVETAEEGEGPPLDEKLLLHLRQRDAFVKVFEALPEGEQKAKLREQFAAALKDVHREETANVIPLLPEVKEGAGAALEVVRRAGLVDRQLADALRDGLNAWAW